MTATRRDDPEYVARECARKQSPEYRAKQAEYKRSPECRAKERERRSTPDFLARKAAYQREQRAPRAVQTPEQRRESERARRQAPAYKERERLYRCSPQYREQVNAHRRRRLADDPAFRDQWKAARAARRALLRGAAESERFTLDEIYRRDRGRCHLCGKKVKRPSASMDHLIPVSHGGPHTRANVALACRSCNSSKGARAVGEQLALC